MNVNIADYYANDDWKLIRAEADRRETPFVVVNLNIVRKKYRELETFFPYARIFYAVKANPAPEILGLLRDLGAGFDIASIYELDKVLSLGIAPERLSYGNTIKKSSDIRYAHERGVRLFATDSEGDLRNIAREAPGSRILLRILTEGAATAEWPLSRKFGCHTDMAIDLALLARDLGLDPRGLSFHVGSQQRDIGAWDAAISKMRHLFFRLETEGIPAHVIDMGGGFPARYLSQTHPLDVYAKEVRRFLDEKFGDSLPEIMLEPGRSLVGDAGVLVGEVILVSQKSNLDIDKWVYLDVGKYNGLVETSGESIRYPLYCEAAGDSSEGFIIAGPTCDSADTMYENFRNPLPQEIKPGDRVYWLSAGAYTASYASVEFNGFPPVKTYFIQ